MIEFVEIEGKPDAAKLKEIEEFYASIFEKIDREKFHRRINEAENLQILLASQQNKIVGFKIGYRLDSEKFYSWIGGVDAKFRNCGIAAELMKLQHNFCTRKGYKIVRTKTRNWFKPMLILNIKNGFDIVGVHHDERNELKIVLEKTLG